MLNLPCAISRGQLGVRMGREVDCVTEPLIAYLVNRRELPDNQRNHGMLEETVYAARLQQHRRQRGPRA